MSTSSIVRVTAVSVAARRSLGEGRARTVARGASARGTMSRRHSAGKGTLLCCGLLLCSLLVLTVGVAAAPRELNGFVLDPVGIPVREILKGGPERDGIPALDHPKSAGAQYDWPDDEWVIGVSSGGETRAYPISILLWHELVNDTLGGRPLLISYCPLCGTALVFDRRVGEGMVARSFGVSGLLYRSDLLMYDRETESLWSQIGAEAITGPSRGERLTLVRSRMTTWARWRALHPETQVLTRDTGHRREYGTSPYAGYKESEKLMFPATFDRRYHPKMPTLGLRIPNGAARAYPAIEVIRAGGGVEERFAGFAVRVVYDEQTRLFEVSAPEPVEVVQGYWFAWAAFHPDTSVMKGSEPED